MSTKVTASAPDRNELAAQGSRLVGWVARSFAHLPAGVDIEDLESSGNEAVAEALETYDPASGLTFTTYARAQIKNAMKRTVDAGRRAARRRVSFATAEGGDGMGQIPDRLGDDPGDAAAERCDPKPASAPVLAEVVANELNDPRAVAKRAAQLRAEVYGSFKTGDMQKVMTSMIKAAQLGDPRCAKLLLDVLGIGQPAE